MSWPKDIAFDGQGNLYVADTANNVIRMVSSAGVITTIAGTGQSDFSGDGGAAIAATMNLPSGLAVDGGGNLFIADTNNFRIRKITTAGLITTVAGNGIQGRSGDNSPAVAAQLTSPTGLAFNRATSSSGTAPACGWSHQTGLLRLLRGTARPGSQATEAQRRARRQAPGVWHLIARDGST